MTAAMKTGSFEEAARAAEAAAKGAAESAAKGAEEAAKYAAEVRSRAAVEAFMTRVFEGSEVY